MNIKFDQERNPKNGQRAFSGRMGEEGGGRAAEGEGGFPGHRGGSRQRQGQMSKSGKSAITEINKES